MTGVPIFGTTKNAIILAKINAAIPGIKNSICSSYYFLPVIKFYP
jgi:hypothetical protein